MTDLSRPAVDDRWPGFQDLPITHYLSCFQPGAQAAILSPLRKERVYMTKTVSAVALIIFLALLPGCGKSSKLQSLLPSSPDGWKTDGGTSNTDTSGVAHASRRSYVPASDAAGMGVGKVTVQILLAEKNADHSNVQKMAVVAGAEMKEREEINGSPAWESFPFGDSDHHDLIVIPRTGTYVEIVAYKGSGPWENTANRKAVVRAFLNKIDMKKIEAME